jgi:hypothetical protein
MPKFVDLIDCEFGSLKVLRRDEDAVRVSWWCECLGCGKTKSFRSDHLTRNAVTSCGCQNPFAFKHGMSHSPEYKIWDAMIQRCSNPKNAHYADYGGRGIVVCGAWKEFVVFYRDMGSRPSSRHTLDRENNDGNYEPSNCRWITQKEQLSNTRRNLNFTYRGETKTLKQWSENLGFNYHNVKYRIHNGMLFEVAIVLDAMTKDSLLTLHGATKSVIEWCRDHLVTFVSFRHRLNNGWTFEEALTPIESKEVTFDGETRSLRDWCGVLGLDESSTYLRILRGESLEEVAA